MHPYSKGEFSVDENLWGRSVEGGRIELENLEPLKKLSHGLRT